MSQKITIRDIARICGVSASSVSRVLNGRTGEVGPEVRDRIFSTIREMNYRPAQSHQVPTPETYTLGIITGIESWDYVGPGYFHAVVYSLLASIAEYKLNSLFFASHLFYIDPLQSIRTYCDGRCDGLIIIAPVLDSPLVGSLQARGFPLVIVGDSREGETTPCCDIDNVQAGRLAAEELLQQGHCRIAYCHGPTNASATWQRLEGLRQALAGYNLLIDEQLIGHANEIRQWTREILGRPAEQRPTAIFCFSDFLARESLMVIRELGLRVPDDVSLIGIDDQGTEQTDPPLTTIRQPYTQIARHVVEMLVAQINHDAVQPQSVVLHGELIRRSSVGPPVTRPKW